MMLNSAFRDNVCNGILANQARSSAGPRGFGGQAVRADVPEWVGIRFNDESNKFEVQYCCEKGRKITHLGEEVDPNWPQGTEGVCPAESDTPTPHLTYEHTENTEAIDGQPNPACVTQDSRLIIIFQFWPKC